MKKLMLLILILLSLSIKPTNATESDYANISPIALKISNTNFP